MKYAGVSASSSISTSKVLHKNSGLGFDVLCLALTASSSIVEPFRDSATTAGISTEMEKMTSRK
jgi:hypothetical protein